MCRYMKFDFTTTYLWCMLGGRLGMHWGRRGGLRFLQHSILQFLKQWRLGVLWGGDGSLSYRIFLLILISEDVVMVVNTQLHKHVDGRHIIVKLTGIHVGWGPSECGTKHKS